MAREAVEEDRPGLDGWFTLYEIWISGIGKGTLHVADYAGGMDETSRVADKGCEEEIGDVVGRCQIGDEWFICFD